MNPLRIEWNNVCSVHDNGRYLININFYPHPSHIDYNTISAIATVSNGLSLCKQANSQRIVLIHRWVIHIA